MGREAWSDEDVKTLRKMVAKGETSTAIAEAVGRNPSTVRQYIRNNARKLGLHLPPIRGRGEKNMASFDREWYGSVPYLHWSITKPWRL
jgi:IS30 family transposase